MKKLHSDPMGRACLKFKVKIMAKDPVECRPAEKKIILPIYSA